MTRDEWTQLIVMLTNLGLTVTSVDMSAGTLALFVPPAHSVSPNAGTAPYHSDYTQ